MTKFRAEPIVLGLLITYKDADQVAKNTEWRDAPVLMYKITLLLMFILLTACVSNEEDEVVQYLTVSSTSPSSGATDVEQKPAIAIKFSANVSQQSLANAINLRNPSDEVEFDLSLKDETVTITPRTLLDSNTGYTVTIKSTVLDQSGSRMQGDYTFSFSTLTFNLDAPSNLLATPGDSTIALTWDSVDTADSYIIYSNDSSGVSPANFLASQVVQTNSVNLGGVNGTTYYYVVVAVSGAIESAPSAEISGTPSSTVTISIGDTQQIISWTQSYQEFSFRLEWAFEESDLGVNSDEGKETKGKVIEGLTSNEYVHTDLENWRTIYYRVIAVTGAGDSVPSNIVFGTPSPLLTTLTAATDPELQTCIDETISSNNLLLGYQVTVLTCAGTMPGVSMLTGLDQYVGLESLDLSVNSPASGTFVDQIVLDKLINLKTLDLSSNNLNSLLGLGAQSSLTVLKLANNAITDVTVLSGLNDTKEFVLELQNNNVTTGVPGLSKFTQAKSISLEGNIAIPCTDLENIIQALTVNVVTPTIAEAGVNCTAQ